QYCDVGSRALPPVAYYFDASDQQRDGIRLRNSFNIDLQLSDHPSSRNWLHFSRTDVQKDWRVGMLNASEGYRLAVFAGSGTTSASSPGTEVFSVTQGGTLKVSNLTLSSLGSTVAANLVIDDNGVVYKASSSARYKEHIEPWKVGPAALAN